MITSEEYTHFLSTKGVPLMAELGIREVALNRSDALAAVELLRKASIPILGGDVYFKGSRGIDSAYANWHSEPISGEDHDRFVSRSCLDTEKYIKGFPDSKNEILFVLVTET